MNCHGVSNLMSIEGSSATAIMKSLKMRIYNYDHPRLRLVLEESTTVIPTSMTMGT